MPNKYKYIHETVVQELLDAIKSIGQIADDDGFLKKKKNVRSYRSITKASSGMTLVFPVACTRTISPETASMLSKAIEQKCVSMMQMLFSAYQISNVENINDFIQQFHKNMKIGGRYTIDDFINDMDSLTESGMLTVNRSELNAITEDMRNINFYLESDLDRGSYVNYKVRGNKIVYEGAAGDPNPLEGENDEAMRRRERDEREREKHRWERYKNDRETDKLAIDRSKARTDFLKNQVLDSDIKKANELQPSLMIVNFMSKDESGRAIPVDGVVIGVKAKLIGLDGSDIVDHLTTKNADRHFLLQLIRASTREISFFRDFIFAVDNAKIDALNNSKAGSANPMWKVLEQRAIKSKLRRFTNGGNDASAITTLIISQSEVEYLRKENNVDMMNPRVIGPIMEAYNFMGIVIVDELLEVAHFMWDTGDDTFEDVSFTNLTRDTADKNYKKVINLMTKLA